jgi:hypothetical protein
MTPRTPKQKLIAALLAALAAFVGYLANEFAGPSEDPAEALQQEVAPPGAFGWVNDPDAVKAATADLPIPRFADTEAYRADPDGPEDVFLWDACRKATGNLLPPRNQGQVGSCVSFGTASAIEHLICVQIASGAREQYLDLAQEIIYGGSRVEIGGGRINGDGSVGAWAAKFVTQYGVVARGTYGRYDLTRYDERRCRDFGYAGVPDELEPVAREHPVKAVTNVRTWAECRAAVRNGYPVAVCSGQGFRMQRDADGFCAPQGSWAHCMAIVGVKGGRRPGAFILNSWGGNAHTGPLGVGNPSPAGFWADANVVDRMLREGDSWAFSSFAGFPSRKLDWYAWGEGARGQGLGARVETKNADPLRFAISNWRMP